MNDQIEKLERILHFASLAPSPHNCQPWEVSVPGGNGLRLVIRADPSRRLPQCDPSNRELMLSIGTFWENLEQAAAALGFECSAEITARQTTDRDIVKVKLKGCSAGNSRSLADNTLTLMEVRCTHRGRYKKEDLSPAHLEACTEGLAAHVAYFPRRSEAGEWLAANQIEAMRQQVFHDGKQAEMADWTRFSRSEAARRGDGTTAEMAGYDGLVKFLWYAFMTPRSLMSGNARRTIVKWVAKRVDRCAGFFIVTSRDSGVAAVLEAGRILERLLLRCTRYDIRTCPMAQLINERPWNQKVGTVLGLAEPVQMVLCTGYSDERPQVHRLRRRVADFTDGPFEKTESRVQQKRE